MDSSRKRMPQQPASGSVNLEGGIDINESAIPLQPSSRGSQNLPGGVTDSKSVTEGSRLYEWQNARTGLPYGNGHGPSKVVCMVNRKGGVGKTTTAFNLAGVLAQKGNQVLMIDLDPMGSLCRSLNIRPDKKALSDLLVGISGSLGELIRKTHIPNLFVIPGDPNLRTLEMRYGASMGYRHALREKLAEVLKWKPFPFVIIDCPPSLGLISGNALIASNKAVIPIDGSTYGMGALVDTLGIIKLVHNNVNQDLSVCGLLLNNVDLSTIYDQTVREVLREQFPDLLFRTVIPTSPESDICSQVGEPVTRYAPSCWMAKAYLQLVDEIVERCTKHE